MRDEAARYPILRFVDAPYTGAKVLVDFNMGSPDGSDGVVTEPLADDFDWGTPALPGDPTAYGRVHGYRRISWTQVVDGSHGAAGRWMTELSRELLRPSNWLFHQLSPESPPMWVRTYVTQQTEGVELGEVYIEDLTIKPGLTITLDADAFLVGQAITEQVGLFNNPTLNAGAWLDLVGIAGDAPAPAVIRIDAPQGGKVNAPFVSIASVPIKTLGWTSPALVQSPTWGSTTAQITASTTSAWISANVREVTLASSGWTTVATMTVAASQVPFPGRWRVMGRANLFPAQTNSYRFRLRTRQAGYDTLPTALSEPVLVHLRSATRWIDFGIVELPAHGTKQLTKGLPSPGPTAVILEAQEASSTGTTKIRLDAFGFMLVPVEGDDDDWYGTTMKLWTTQFSGFSASNPMSVLIDGELRILEQAMNATTQTYPLGTGHVPAPRNVGGGFPVIRPGFRNVLTVLMNVDPRPEVVGPQHDEPGIATTVSVTYRPRYLNPIGGG